MNNIPSITKNLLIINVLAFFATWVFEKQGLDLTATFGLHFFMAKDFSFYQLVTYLFMHGSFMHLFFNMFAVWMFGTVMERVWGPKRFLIYYLVCGIGAGIIQEGVQYINYANENLAAYDFVMTSSGRITTEAYLNLWTTVGASGAVYAILLAFGMTFPNERMFIIPFPFPIKAKWLIGGYIVIEVWSALNTPGDGIAHMAHLGGMLFGFLLIRYWRKHPNIEQRFNGQNGFFQQMKKQYENKRRNTFHYQPSTETPRWEEHKEKEEDSARQAEIDAILDKIRKSGYDSLTKEEKKKLFEQSNRN
ncbi:rhomboid family intramembrane serine protease [Prevotella sp. P3-120]|uniref:Rhomboid family intramembrane serine protease n=1 Tax=Xylanibacter brevis TaxID=83231 RepID=A0ABS9CI92_9BACT|nr:MULTISPECIES: rhomboid family intramembrane serine protease [Prevotellaceae]MBS7318752.1 rhomboid family intramembrane serine protease [Prevotella sp.]MCF2558841.1 rhomboid family intramembrane serine protease [Xylanibacter brevis]MCF2564280.1 rhomboid family intramembrane serine protease [Xylanibacter brevis]MCI7001283.1 rhomboid family intramembrane serine protease [Prevotella sp.]MDD7173191.1 rhomboid family intramembrane serine protease [Prevotella sp.]